MKNKKLFTEFSEATKAEWLAKVEKDLKGKPLDSLNWQPVDDLEYTPFAHPEDLADLPAPIRQNKMDNAWQIGYAIAVNDVKAGNKEALMALENGANALQFQLPSKSTVEELSLLLKDIQHEWIATYFYIDGENLTDFSEKFSKVVTDKNQNPTNVKGGIFSSDKAGVVDPSSFPHFKYIEIKDVAAFDPLNPIPELANLVFQMHQLLQNVSVPGQLIGQIQIETTVSDSYFLSIAKLRALKLLIGFLLEQWQAEITDSAIPIAVRVSKLTQTEDENYNKIRATTQAMSAVIGGADLLLIEGSDAYKKDGASHFNKRIALNVQHLLQLESYMDRVVDPAAGSYYIENMTDDLATKAWQAFVDKI